MIVKYLRWVFFCLATLILATGQAAAKSAPLSPDLLIEDATRNLLDVVDEARGYFDEDPERFYLQVESIIAPLVDFYSFSRGVMGRWGSRAYYQSLPTKEDKQRFDAQVRRFTEVFRAGLIRTYGKGLLAFSGETIEVQPVPAEEIRQGVVTVVQLIHGSEDKPYVIRYKMRQGKDGTWKIRNVTLDTLNLGKVYQNQFASAAGKYNGDIDQVIDNWSVTDVQQESQ